MYSPSSIKTTHLFDGSVRLGVLVVDDGRGLTGEMRKQNFVFNTHVLVPLHTYGYDMR
jgi:hypothetical protein